jgi:hypothetical protein
MVDEPAYKSALTVGFDIGGKPGRALSAIGETPSKRIGAAFWVRNGVPKRKDSIAGRP